MARRRPGWLVAAVFLWAPAVLIVALMIGREALVPALIAAAVPYLGVLLWVLIVAVRESRPATKGLFLLGLLLFAVFAASLNWGPPLEY